MSARVLMARATGTRLGKEGGEWKQASLQVWREEKVHTGSPDFLR